jgi:hypothetical protein
MLKKLIIYIESGTADAQFYHCDASDHEPSCDSVPRDTLKIKLRLHRTEEWGAVSKEWIIDKIKHYQKRGYAVCCFVIDRDKPRTLHVDNI